MRTEKKERKKLTKKQIMTIIIPVVAVAVLAAVIVPSVIWAKNIFRVGKVDQIIIGDAQEQVIKVLGEPYEKSDFRYEYYSKEYVQLAEKRETLSEDIFGNLEQLAKLEEQINALTYQYIRVDFDSDKKVTEVFFDNAKRENGEDKKSIKSYDVQGETSIQQYDTLNLTYKVKYTDGSLYKAAVINQVALEIDSKKIEWNDLYGNEYSVLITISPIITLTSEIVTLIAGGEKSTLTDIIIPSSVTSIGASAFYGCSSLTSIEIPSSVTSIGDTAFFGCSSLINIEIPDSVTSIGSYSTFYGCSSLISITIPSGVTSIGSFAFHGCSSLTSIEIPSSVTSVGSVAFYGCSSLTSITIPSGVTKIGSSAFYGCSSLTSVTIPSGVKSIGSSAFDGCSSLTSVEIPSSVTSIGYFAFSNCSSLTGITIPSSVINIGYSAFSNCSGLTSVTIPSSVITIDPYAFYGCSSLISVTFENTSGWYMASKSTATSGTSVDVTNPSANATNLMSTYFIYYWKRNA